MANRRILVKRRKAATNIRKITRTMQMIATARFQAAYNAAVAGRPYTEKLAELVASLARAAGGVDHPLMRDPESPQRAAVIPLTSMRGLAGGYNANLLQRATTTIDELRAAEVDVETHMVGKKGISYFKFLDRPLAAELTRFGERPRYDEVEALADELMERFVAGELDAVWVVYTKFVSIGKQVPTAERLLPLAAVGADPSTPAPDYEFSPDPASLLDEILPATVRVRLFQAFTDAAVSEQIARMVAMKGATDAAEEMIRSLTLQYNRARQTQITMELLDIVGGAAALA